MLKVLQARLQQYVNWELSGVQAGFKKGRGTRDQIANIHWIINKAREFQKNICFIGYTKAFDCVDHNKLLKILQAMGIPDHLLCLLRNLYAGQEAYLPLSRYWIWNPAWPLTNYMIFSFSNSFIDIIHLPQTSTFKAYNSIVVSMFKLCKSPS